MKALLKRLTPFFLALCFGNALHAQISHLEMSKEDTKSLFAELYETMQQTHPNLYEHISKEEYDKAYEDKMNLIDTMKNSYTENELLWNFYIPFASLCRDGHSSVYLIIPWKELKKYQNGDQSATDIGLDVADTVEQRFPFFFSVAQGKMYNRYNCFNDEIPVKSEIVSIDGRPITKWLKNRRNSVSTERDEHAYALIGAHCTSFTWTGKDSCHFGFIPYGAQDTLYATLSCLTSERQYNACIKKMNTPKEDLTFQTFDEPDIAMITIRDFPKKKESMSFINGLLERLQAHNTKDLIIDVRYSLGGYMETGKEIIDRITDKPYRIQAEEQVYIRPGMLSYDNRWPSTLWKARKYLKKSYAKQALKSGKDTIIYKKYPMKTPKLRKNQFTGRIWVLTSAYSYSAAAGLASVVQDCNLGVVVGEETGGVPNTYANPLHYQLNKGHFYYYAPFVREIRPSGETAMELRGIIPDIEIAPNIIPEEDLQLQELIKIIQKRQKEDLK